MEEPILTEPRSDSPEPASRASGFLPVAGTVAQLLMGMLFVVSAVLKFITIDSFEIYVYSFGLVGLTTSFYLSRLVIAAELLLGAALISHRHRRFTLMASLLFLVCFILFLAYAHLSGRTDSCHCFGELFPFSPVESILKNAVLIVLVLFAYKYGNASWAPRWWTVLLIYLAVALAALACMVWGLHVLDYLALIMIAVTAVVGLLASFPFYRRWFVTLPLVLTPIVTVFILTPPDSWYFNGSSERYNQELLLLQIDPDRESAAAMTEGDSTDVERGALAAYGLDEGRHLVALFSPGCAYCRLAAEKLSTIVSRGDIDEDKVLYVFPQVDKEEAYEQFYAESRSLRFRECRIDKLLFLKITYGEFPLVLLVEDGEVTASYAYRNLKEDTLIEFLSES